MSDINQVKTRLDAAIARLEAKGMLPEPQQQQQIDPFTKAVWQQASAGVTNAEQDFNPVESVPSSSVGGVVKDTVVGAGKGVITVGADLALGTLDKVSQGYDGLRQLATTGDINQVDMDNNKSLLSDLIGADSQEAKEILGEYNTDAHKYQQQKLAEDVATADGFTDASLKTLKRLYNSPNLAFGMLGESAPLMGAGGVIGRGLNTIKAIEAAKLGGALGEATISGAMLAQDYERTTGNNFGLSEVPELAVNMAGTALASRFLGNRYDIETMGTGAISKAGRGLDAPTEIFQEYIQGMVQSATEQSANTGEINPNQLGSDAVAEAYAAMLMTAPQTVLPTTSSATGKAVNVAQENLATKHEDLVNPTHKKFSPKQAYANAQTAYHSATTDEAKQTAQQQMQQAEDALYEGVSVFETRITNETDETKKQQLTTQRDNWLKDQLTTINSAKDALNNAEDGEFDVNSIIDNFSKLANANTSTQQQEVADVDLSQYKANETAVTPTTPVRNSLVAKMGDYSLKDTGVGTGDHYDMRIASNSKIGTNDKGHRDNPSKYMDRFHVMGKPLSSYTPNSGYEMRKGKMHWGLDYSFNTTFKQNPQSRELHIAPEWLDKVTNVSTRKDDKGGGYFTRVEFNDGLAIHILHQNAVGTDEVNKAQANQSQPTQAIPTVSSNTGTLGKNTLSKPQQDMMKMVANALDKHNLSNEFKRVLMGQIGREGSYNFHNLVSSHSDDANNASNIGIISFQKQRNDNLKKFLAQKGLYSNGKFTGTQEQLVQGNIDFIIHELTTDGNYAKSKALMNSDDSNAIYLALSDNYIRWARVDKSGNPTKWTEDGERNYNDFYNIASGLYTGNATNTSVETDNRQADLLTQLENETDAERITELEDELAKLQEQQTNTNQEQTQPTLTPEQETFKAENEDKIVRRYSRIALEEDLDKAKQEINQLQQAGILSEDKATSLVSLLDIKARIKSNNSSSVSEDIYRGSKHGDSNLETNLGLRDYQRVFNTGTPATVSKYMGYLENFEASHHNKSQILQQALQEAKATNTNQYVGFVEGQGWSMVSKEVFDNKNTNDRVYEIHRGSERFVNQVTQEANDITTFKNDWQVLLNQPRQSVEPVQATRQQQATVTPTTEQTPIVEPVQSSQRAVDSDTAGYAPNPSSMNDDNGVWVGRNANVSMSNVENVNKPFLGMFGNPFNENANSAWSVPKAQQKQAYKEKLAEYYSNKKKPFFKDEVEKLRGKKLYSGMRNLQAMEIQAIKEFLDETQNMTDEQKFNYARNLAQAGRDLANDIKKGKTKVTPNDEPTQRSTNNTTSNNDIPVLDDDTIMDIPVSDGLTDEELVELDLQNQQSELDYDEDVELDLDDEVATTTQEVISPKQSNDSKSIKFEQEQEEIDISKGSHELLDVIEHIDFNDTQLVIANAIVNKYPDTTVSFDGSSADMILPNAKPETLLARLVLHGTRDVLANPNKSQAHEKVHQSLDYVISKLSQYETTNPDEQALIQELLQSKEALVSLGTSIDKYKDFLKSIETKERKVKSNLFSTLVRGFMSFLGIPAKATTINLYESLLATTGNAVELQAKDNKSYVLSMVSDKATREEEQAKDFYEQNLITSSFSQDNTGNLSQVKSLSSRLIQKGIKEIKRLGVKEPTQKQQEQLNHYLWFEQEFKSALYKSFQSKKDEYKWQDLKQFLNIGTDDNPIFDDNVISALALSAYDYIALNGGSSFTSAEDISNLLGLGEDTLIPNRVLYKYKDAGISVNEVIIDLGKNAVKSLGLTAIDTAPSETKARLESSLGDWILTVMLDNNLAVKNTYSQQELENDKSSITGKPADTKAEMATKTTITLNPLDKELTTVTDIVEKSKGTSGYLSNLYGSSTRRRNVSLEPIEETIDRIDSTSSNVSKEQMETIKRVQKEPMKLNQSMTGIMDWFVGNNIDVLHEMFGAKVYTEEELQAQGVHISQRESQIKSAQSNLRALESYLDFKEGLPSADTVFYDLIKVVKNTRMHYNSNVVNFQSEKIHRALMEYANFEVTLNTDNFINGVWFDEKGNPTPETYFLRAVFENAEGTEDIFKEALKGKKLSDGFTVDKLSSENFIPTALKIINSRDVTTASRGIHNIQAGKKPTDAQMKAIQKVVKEWGMGANSFRALVEVANLKKAMAENKPFVTSLGLGSDGVNNGTGIGMVQMGINETATLQRLGMFKHDDVNQSYFDTRTDTSIGDYYTAFKEYLLGAVENSIEALHKKAQEAETPERAEEILDDIDTINALRALNTSLEKRKILKAILIPFGYGAGNPRLVRASAEQMIKDIYSTFTKIHEEKDTALYEATQTQLQAIFGENYKLPTIDELLDYEFSPKEYALLIEAYETLLGKSIAKAVEAYAEEFIDRRNFNVDIHNSISKTFIQARTHLLEQVKAKHEQSIKDKYKDATDKELERLLAYHTLSAKDIREQVDKPLQKMFATIRTRHQVEDENETGSIEFVKSEKTFRQDISIKAITQVFNPKTKGLKDKTNSNVFIRDKNLVDTGVTPNSQMTQQQDAYVSSKAMVAGDVVSINVHDANIGNLVHYDKMANEQNKAFFHGTAKYHQYAESLEALITTIESIYEAMGEGYVTSEVAIELIESLIGDSIPNANTTGELIQKVVTSAVNIGIGYDQDKLRMMSELSTIAQYSGEAGQYTVTDSDRQMLQEQMEVLEEQRTNLLKRLDKAVKKFNHPLDYHTQVQERQGNANANTNTTTSNQSSDSNKPVNIYFGTNENAELSNLALRPFTTKDGTKYYSVEHYYQTNKTGSFNERLYNNPRWARAGTKIAYGKVKTDNGYNITLMKEGMKLSFEQNPRAQQLLLATGDRPLTHRQDTSIWGRKFPELLMEVREELASNPMSEMTTIQVSDEVSHHVPSVLVDSTLPLSQAINHIKRLISTIPTSLSDEFKSNLYWILDSYSMTNPDAQITFVNSGKFDVDVSKVSGRTRNNHDIYINTNVPSKDVDMLEVATHEIIHTVVNPVLDYLGDNVAPVVNIQNIVRQATQELQNKPRRLDYFLGTYQKDDGTIIDVGVREVFTIGLTNEAVAKVLRDIPMVSPKTGQPSNAFNELLDLFNDLVAYGHQQNIYRSEYARNHLSTQRNQSGETGNTEQSTGRGESRAGENESSVPEYATQGTNSQAERSIGGQSVLSSYDEAKQLINTLSKQDKDTLRDTVAKHLNTDKPTLKQVAEYVMVFGLPVTTAVEYDKPLPYNTTADNPMQIYVDGSDIKGTGAIGYGAYAQYNNQTYELSGTNDSQSVKELGKLFPDAKFSNPTMEMLGLLETLKQFANTAEHIVINQDYKGAVNYNGLWLKSEGSNQREPKAWNAKEPYIKHIVQQAEQLISQIEANGGSVHINWVKGHQKGDSIHKHGNDNADRVAKSRQELNSFLTTKQIIEVSNEQSRDTAKGQGSTVGDVQSTDPRTTGTSQGVSTEATRSTDKQGSDGSSSTNILSNESQSSQVEQYILTNDNLPTPGSSMYQKVVAYLMATIGVDSSALTGNKVRLGMKQLDEMYQEAKQLPMANPTTTTPQQTLNQFLLNLAKQVNPTLKVETKSYADSSFGGEYVPSSNTVYINDTLKGDDYYKVLNHEIYHALTETGLTKNTQAVKDLKAIHQQLKDKAQGKWTNELHDINEFVAYVMTDKAFMDWVLANMDLKSLGIKPKTDKLREFVNIVLHVFGLGKSNQNLNTLVSLVNNVMEQYDPNSIGDTVHYSTSAEATQTVNETNISQVFKDLPTNVSEAHNEHLDSIIDNIIGTYNHTHGRSRANIKQGKIKNTSLLNGYKTSDKEAHVTDALVTVFEAYLDSHKGTLAVNGLYNLYKDALSQYQSAKDLFPDFSQASKEDKAKMTKMYNFVFNNGSKQSSVARFMAMNLANEQFRNLMGNTVKSRQTNDSWFDKVMGIFEKVLGWFNQVYFRPKSNQHKDVIDAMTKRLVDLDIKARNSSVDLLQLVWERGLELSTKFLDNPAKKVLEHTAGFIRANVPNHPSMLPLRALSMGILASIEMNKAKEQTGESVANKLMAELNQDTRYKFIQDILNEVTQYGKRGKWIEQAVRLTQSIGRIRQGSKDSTLRVLNEVFNGPLSKTQKTHLTQAVLRTELSALIRHGFSLDKLSSILANPNKTIEQYAQRLIDKVGYDKANDMLMQSKALGFYMANEQTVRNLTKSTQGIAVGLGTDYETTFDEMDKEVYELVDVLSTLYAVSYTSDEAISTVKQLLQDEPLGMQTVLKLHKGLVDKSYQEFGHNPLNYQKGYLPQVVNPYRKLMWATTTEEINQLKQEGFEIIDVLTQDSLDNTEARTLMLHTAYASTKRVSGGLDMADTHSRGTTIYEQGIHDADIRRVAKDNLNHRKQRNKQSYQDYDPSVDKDTMVAIYATDGAILSYHYEMSGTTQDTFLERDNSFDELLGTLHGSLLFKEEMRQHQRDIAKQIFEDQANDYHKKPNEYVVLDFDSTDPHVQEVMKMLPYAFREEIIKRFGDNPVAIHKSVYTAMFGFRAYSIANMFDKLNNPEAKLNKAEKLITGIFKLLFKEQARQKAVNFEKLIQDLMSTIKDYIVVRGGGVLLGNIISNMLLLSLRGINPVRILKDSIFAWRNTKRYTTTQAKVNELQVKLLGLTDTKQIGLIQRQLKALNKELLNNPMHEFMVQGLMSTIVEDLSLQEDKYKTPLQQSMDKYLERIPKPIRNVVGVLSLERGTVGHNFLSEATQFSDLSAKYVLAKYNMDKGMALDEAIYESQVNFINYDIPTNQFLDYMNRMGFMIFTKFFLRFQQVMLKMAHKMPIASLAQYYGVEYLGGQGIYEPFIFNRFGNPFDGSISLADNVFADTIVADVVKAVL